MLPALRLELKLLVVARDELRAKFWLCYVANHLYIVYLLYLMQIAYWYGEEKFIILAAIERTSGNIH